MMKNLNSFDFAMLANGSNFACYIGDSYCLKVGKLEGFLAFRLPGIPTSDHSL
jgi:hypothetical protein